jgi:hypothetical protein
MKNTSLQLFALTAFLSFICLSGCGDGLEKRVPVSGVVLIDGKPLEIGNIQVVPDKGRPATGRIGPGGRFTLTTFNDNDGCFLGKHKVIVIAKEDKTSTSTMWHAPKKYADLSASGLEINITGPTDNLEIKLKWEGGKPFIENLY